jgi:hypothetical protein
MMSSKKKIEKRKQREKLVRKKVLERREEIRKERKIMHQELLKEKTMDELNNGKQQQLGPGHPELAIQKEEELKQKKLEKIKKNLEVLKGLQEEFEKEQNLRNQLNQKLEDEGHFNMADKMNALQEKAAKMRETVEEIEQENSDLKSE